MLDFGFSEVVVTSLIALVVLGPKKLPTVARQVGNWMGRARAMARQLSDQLDREVNAEELLKEKPRKPPVVPVVFPEPLPPDPQPAVTAAPAPDIDPLSPAAMHANDPPAAANPPGLKSSNE